MKKNERKEIVSTNISETENMKKKELTSLKEIDDGFAPPGINPDYRGICSNKKCGLDLRQINQWDRIGKPEAGGQFVETWQMTAVSIQVNWAKEGARQQMVSGYLAVHKGKQNSYLPV